MITMGVVRTLAEYPPGYIGTITALFGRLIAASHGVDWTLELMIAEAQIEFFRRFDPTRDRVWFVTRDGVPKGGLTIEGPKSASGQEGARLRFFILDESVRGHGLGRRMVTDAMRFCRDQGYPKIYLTTLPGLDAALHLYAEQGFVLVSEREHPFHGSRHAEQLLECRLS